MTPLTIAQRLASVPVLNLLVRPLLRLHRERGEARRQIAEWSRFVAPGHYYSPVPNGDEIDRAVAWVGRFKEPAGIDLNIAHQEQLLEALRPLYASVPFPEERRPDYRYFFNNQSYCYSDAIFLHLLIRHCRPERIIEIGSGYSSCVMLDTNKQFFQDSIHLTFIEPYPDVLRGLLSAEDATRCTILAEKVQDVPLEVFDQLEQGDILFIDSSHVGKAGSDVHYELFQILPRLKRGVFIHVHDIFDGFEYPEEWLKEGRAWNEAYMLRAFLQFNSAFRIVLFNTLMERIKREWFATHMPDCLKNTGGSIWLERVA